MLIVDRAELRSLLTGRTRTLTATQASSYRKGQLCEVGLEPGRSTWHVEILDVDEQQLRVKVRLARPDKPRLLARNPAGQRTDYVSLDPNDPDEDLHRAMFDEPEPIGGDELERMTRAARERRHQAIAKFRDQVIEQADELAADADRADRRRLRNVSRTARSL